MLKYTAWSLLLGLLVTPAIAQSIRSSDTQRGFHAGLSVGMNFVDIRNPFDFPDPEIDHVYYAKPSVGVLGGYHFDPVFAIRTGLLYTPMGRKAEETLMRQNESVAVEKTVDLTYLQVPLLLRLMIGSARVGAFVQAGPVYSLLQGVEVVRNGVEQDTNRRFRDNEIGLLLEGGPSYAFTERVYATLSFRGYLGVTDLNHEDLDTTGRLVGKSQNVAGGFHFTLNVQLSGGK